MPSRGTAPADNRPAIAADSTRESTGGDARPDTGSRPLAERRPASKQRGPVIDRLVTITLDPGHGGEDPGATGRGGSYEKHVTLAVAKRLQAKIAADPNMRAVLTRESDFFVPLRARVQKARRIQSDLFVSIHADAFARRTEDYRIPGGAQKNTATDSKGGSIGGSYFFAGGYIGAAVTQNNSLYHIPGAEGEEVGTRIDARQTKFSAKGEYRPDSAAIDAIRFWLGATDYKHNELGLADAADPGSDGVRQTFTNREQEGRLEVQFAPVNLRFAALTTAFGVQASHQELTAPSPDDPASPLNGLWDPNRNGRLAGYVFNEFRFSDVTRAQVAARIAQVNLNGTTPSLIPETFDLATDPAAIGPAVQRNLSFTPKSGSIGLIQNLPWGLVASVTGQYVERAPKPAELFSRGGHDATETFDIGNPDLGIETAKSVEAGLRRATGPFRFELTGYYTRFNGFIYRRLTGNTCAEGACIVGDGLELNQAVYSQRDATFRGAEFQFQYDVLPVWNGLFGIEGQYDIVRATFADGSNVPRIPPQRLGGGIYYRDQNWLARVNLLHAFAQNDISAVETPTAGYNRLRAELSYTTRLAGNDGWGAQQVTLGIVGDNLLNEEIRNAAAYNKDEVQLPGLGVRLFANVKY